MSDIQVLIDRGGVWLTGNAARPPGEPQAVIRLRRVSLDPRPALRATHVEIPQVADRHAVCLAKPVWTWGATMGVNEYGVAIGATTAATRRRAAGAGLIGPDLVRLGLERGATAHEAMHAMTVLLERHGQGGAVADGMRGDAGFLIADPYEAWVLETAGRHWVARGVQRFRAISGALTLRADYDLASRELLDRRRDFARRFGRPLRSRLAGDGVRRAAAERGLARLADNGAAPPDLFALLRRAEPGPDGDHAPHVCGRGDPCRHAAGGLRRWQATNAMVARLTPSGMRTWFTGTSAPCLSLFRPVRLDEDTDWSVLTPLHREPYAPLWRAYESVHRRALFDAGLRAEIRADLAETEDRMRAVDDGEAAGRAREWQQRQMARIRGLAFRYTRDAYGRFWRARNRADRIE